MICDSYLDLDFKNDLRFDHDPLKDPFNHKKERYSFTKLNQKILTF